MMRQLSRSGVILGVVAVLLGGAGAAYALTTTSRTISACVRHKGGALYQARKCAKHDKRLNWNKQGPAGSRGATGATGSQGPQGAQGAQGATGPSNGYFSSASNNTQAVLSLPAGDYVLQGVAGLSNPNTSGSGVDQVTCLLQAIGPGTVNGTFNGTTVPSDNGEATLSVEGDAHLPASSSAARRRCRRRSTQRSRPSRWAPQPHRHRLPLQRSAGPRIMEA